jgi:hypothetical protein
MPVSSNGLVMPAPPRPRFGARPRASTPDAKPSLLHQLAECHHHASCRPARNFLVARNDRDAGPASLGSVEFDLGPLSPADTSLLRCPTARTEPLLSPSATFLPAVRQPLFPEARPPKLDLPSRPACSEPRPWPTTTAASTLHQRDPAPASSRRPVVSRAPCDPFRFGPPASKRAFAFHILSTFRLPKPARPLRKAGREQQPPGETSRLPRPVYHHSAPMPSTSSPRHEGLVSVPVSRRPRSTLRPALRCCSRRRSAPDLSLLSTSQPALHGFPRRHNEWRSATGPTIPPRRICSE